MTQQKPREAEHEITVRAPAAAVYRLIADVENWPSLFPPTVHVDHVEQGDALGSRDERIRIWATTGDEVRNWTSRRRLDPNALRIDFRQEVSTPPVAAMGGAWIVEPLSEEQCRVRLLHDYRAVGDDPASLDLIESVMDRNSDSELAALKTNAELATSPPSKGLLMSFEDTVRIAAPAKDVYDFLNEAGLWADRLPHVAKVSLLEASPGTQVLVMDTVADDGSVHTTSSVRVCFPHHRIVYKQLTLPALLTLHTGRWQLDEDDHGGTVVSARHTVAISPDHIAGALGPDAGSEQARTFVRNALGGNSRATLDHAKEHVERRR